MNKRLWGRISDINTYTHSLSADKLVWYIPIKVHKFYEIGIPIQILRAHELISKFKLHYASHGGYQ